MKALKINAKNKTVVEVQKGDGIDDIYKHIGCTNFDVFDFLNGSVSCYVDDEALCKTAYIDEDGEKHNMSGFKISGFANLIIGNGLVLGFDASTGESTDCPITIQELKNLITWVEFDRPEDRPEPQITFMSWGD